MKILGITVKNRVQASLVHLACSIFVASIAVALVYLVWYPGALATATGVTKIFKLILIVDVAIGPLLTLIVFNQAKPELKRDLLIIGLIQIAALSYGLYTVANARPVFVIHAIDRFELVHAGELTADKLAGATEEEFKTVSFLGPKWAAAKLPDDIEEKNDLLFNSSSGGADVIHFPKYYIKYAANKAETLKRLKPLSNLTEFNADSVILANALKKYGGDGEHYGYLPLAARSKDLTVVLTATDTKVVEIIDLTPW